MNSQDLMAKAMRTIVSAKVLLDDGDPDGASDRAYYAMFNAARAALLNSGFDLGKTHRDVHNAFNDRLIKNGHLSREMGRLIKRAETLRCVADYTVDSVKPNTAKEMVEQAETFVETLRAELCPENPSEDDCERELGHVAAQVLL